MGSTCARWVAGWRYYTRAEAAPYVERFVLDGQQARLTQAALETLSVVAYKQPVSRARVSAIRGVNVDGVMRTLVARGLVEEAGSDTESQATLYRTTTYFLERMGMQSLDDLPELAPYLPDMDDIEEELAAQTLPPASTSTEDTAPAESTEPAESAEETDHAGSVVDTEDAEDAEYAVSAEDAEDDGAGDSSAAEVSSFESADVAEAESTDAGEYAGDAETDVLVEDADDSGDAEDSDDAADVDGVEHVVGMSSLSGEGARDGG